MAGQVAVRLRAGHPWVFREALGRPVAEPTGTLVDLLTGNQEFVARGFVDQDHPVSVRVLTRTPNERPIPGSRVVAGRVSRAVQLRSFLFGPERPSGMRLFSGESEGLPGATVDRFADFLLVQWLSAGALPWREELYDALEEAVSPRGIYEQRRLRPLAGRTPPEPATRARGAEAPLEVVVDEAGCQLAVDLRSPVGVGFFPDLRLGRDAVAARASGRRVLNLFSHTGAFSLRAVKAGATEVVAVDTAAKAHARARRNFELSDLDPKALEAVTADALKVLDRFAARGRRFDLVVCDPPTFAHGPSGQLSVARDLTALAAASTAVLDAGGILAFGTNSARVSVLEVDHALAEGAAAAGADLRIFERVGLPPDFPVAPGFPEGSYLKFVLAVRA